MRSALLAASIWAVSLRCGLAAVQYGGINLAGFDFGCETTGECDTAKVVPPLHEYKGQDGAAQMQHFVKVDGFNAFRLPVAWQFLVESPGSPLIPANMEQYDALVKACLATGSLCIIDIHNYARWDGLIIGQGGPTDEEFANLWSQLAKQYADSPKVAMGIVNEPHEVPSITRWAQTCQTVVDAIRKAGATEHFIMLPGNGYTSASSFVSSGSAAALATVKDTDGSTSKLIFEVHKYLDDDNSGTSIECVSNQIDKFEDLTKFLTDNNRQAILAEVGGGPTTKSCLKDVCELLTYLNDNSAVYMGYLGWGAGSFDQTYELSLTPKGDPRKGTPMKSVPLVTECFARLFSGTGSGNSSSSGGDSSYSGTGSSSGGGNIPPKPSSPNNIPPYPTNTGGSGNGGVPMSTGGAMPNGQGAYQPTTFAISYTSSPPSQSSGAATGSSPGEGQGSSPGGDQSSNTGTQNSGQPPVAAGTGGGEVADDECENDDGEEVGKDECPNDAEEPDSQPASEPVKQPAKQPVTEPAKKPVSQSASEVAEDECEADGGTWVKD
ncbi:MAG: hypothetical protein LQ348_006090 [Seirophora lacunosa]|nr:MAG: hypothetical protein LQ344_002692 [Seirophora lacunosa]KAI4175907.1 MAG: hypothetical protein LQ348_006090 [Seirophora lacunosa]